MKWWRVLDIWQQSGVVRFHVDIRPWFIVWLTGLVLAVSWTVAHA